jgi:hypothetical protein
VKQGLEKRIWEKSKKLGVNRDLKREYGKKTLVFSHILFSSPCLALVFYFFPIFSFQVPV